jgi:hypothetical protein
MTEYGELFHCKRDDNAIPISMMCIYAVDASGYMTGCRSGDHLQHCGNEYDRLSYLFILCNLTCKILIFYCRFIDFFLLFDK